MNNNDERVNMKLRINYFIYAAILATSFKILFAPSLPILLTTAPVLLPVFLFVVYFIGVGLFRNEKS
jgi:hypothetical protein